MRAIAIPRLIGVLSVTIAMLTTTAQAARLVVMAVNSGDGTTPGAQPPSAVPGAKGFLIGINNLSDPIAALAFDLTFSPLHLVQRLAPNSVTMGTLMSQIVQTRSQAITANSNDDPDGTGGTSFASNDSWWWNGPYTVGSTTLSLNPISSGIQGGDAGGSMKMIGQYQSGTSDNNAPPGVWPIAYIVATGDISISGLLASGQNGFDPCGFPTRQGGMTYLEFDDEYIYCPESSSLVLSGMGLIVLGVLARRPRKSTVHTG